MKHGYVGACAHAAIEQVWDPATPTQMPMEKHMVEPDFLTATIHNFYACNFVLPTGDVYSQLDGLVRFYKPDGAERGVTWEEKRFFGGGSEELMMWPAHNDVACQRRACHMPSGLHSAHISRH
jgi:hypothetical protein